MVGPDLGSSVKNGRFTKVKAPNLVSNNYVGDLTVPAYFDIICMSTYCKFLF